MSGKYDMLWIMRNGTEFVRKDVANMIYKKLVINEKFKYDGTHNGQNATDVFLFRLKQEFGKIGFQIVDNVNKNVLETTLSLNMFLCSI